MVPSCRSLGDIVTDMLCRTWYCHLKLNGSVSCRKNSSPEEDLSMKKNVGSVERVIRIIAGIAILSLAFIGPKSSWAYLGIIPLATGLIGWCPPYALLGISTCKISK